MAVSASFKQTCPSCEALVPIKDGSLIGKKVDCPKCKYRFVVEDPVAKDKKAVKGANGKAKPKGEVEEVDEAVDEIEVAPAEGGKGASRVKANGSGAVKKAPKRVIRDDDEDEDEQGSKRAKKKASSGKLILGIGLAAVGVVVLAVAALAVSGVFGGGGKTDTPQGSASKGGAITPGGGAIKPVGDSTEPENPLPKTVKEKNKDPEPEVVVESYRPGPAATVEHTNFLPLGAENVFHIRFKNLLDSPIGKVAFKPGQFTNEEFISRLGFPIEPVDDVVTAESYSDNWTFMVIHSLRPVNDMRPLLRAMDLQEWKQNPNPHYRCYAVNKNAAWLLAMKQLALFVPSHVRNGQPTAGEGERLLLHLRDPQTLIFAHREPMSQYLRAGGKIEAWSANLNSGSSSKTEPKQEPKGPGNKFGPDGPGNPGGGAGSIPGPGNPGGGYGMPLPGNPGPTNPGLPGGGGDKPGKTGGPGQGADQFQQPGAADQFQQDPGRTGGKDLPVTGDPGQTGPRSKPGRGGNPDDQPGKDGPEQPGVGGTPMEVQPPRDPYKSDAYLTVKPALREMLLRVEKLAEGEKLLFSSASYLRSALMRSKNADDFGRIRFRLRPLWDVVNVLEEKTDRIEYVANALIMRDFTTYCFQNGLACGTEAEAKKLQTDLYEVAGPEVVNFFQKVVDHKVELIKPEIPTYDPTQGGDPSAPGIGPGFPGPGVPPGASRSRPGPPGDTQFPGRGAPGMDQGGQPQPKKEEVKATASRIQIGLAAKNVDFTLDLVLGGQAMENMRAALDLMVAGLKAEVDLAAGEDYRFALGDAAKNLGDKGLSKQQVPPGTYPPGAFHRKLTPTNRTTREPGNRISWMAAMLPYLGHQTLYNRINFDSSWKDQQNWLAARTLVPQFLDPTYPLFSRYCGQPGMPLECAATHYVGIAGVGLDSAEALAGDPAMLGKLGLFGYERMTTLEQIGKARGRANTVFMIRVPYDGPAGVTPWMAGGGSTVRNVPDKNSLEPFLSTEANGERGTYVIMCDGSVRFLKKGMSDQVFKAIVTVDGPTPEDWSFDDDVPPIPRPVKPKSLDDKKNKPIPVPTGGTGKAVAGGKSPVTKESGKGIEQPQQQPPVGDAGAWKLQQHIKGGFVVMMPGKAQDTPGPNDGETKGGLFATDLDIKQTYIVRYDELPADAKGKPLEEQVRALVDVIKKSMPENSKFHQMRTTLSQLPAVQLEVIGEKDDGIAVGRCCVVGNRVYLVFSTGDNLSPQSQTVQRLFDSFRITNNGLPDPKLGSPAPPPGG